ncbi:MAG: spore coat protein YlbD [Bacilli bacterium]
MSSKEDFKKFVSLKPYLIDSVDKKEVTWQKLFEIYDLYGEDSSVWEKYKKKSEPSSTEKSMLGSITGASTIKDIISSLKKVNMDSLEENISSIRKAVGFLEDLAVNKNSNDAKEIAKKNIQKKKKKGPEPITRFFDD